MSIEDQILKYVTEELLEEDLDITPASSLFQEKLLDSMTLTVLIRFIEDTFAIRVRALDVIFENFDSVDNMVSFIKRKRGEK